MTDLNRLRRQLAAAEKLGHKHDVAKFRAAVASASLRVALTDYAA